MFSVLPVRQLTKLCSKAQTEEVHSDDCTGDDDGLCKIKKDADTFTHNSDHATLPAITYYSVKTAVAIHRASVLPDHFTPSIPTPPPDQA